MINRNIVMILWISLFLTACGQKVVSKAPYSPYTIDMSQLFEDVEKTTDFKWNDLAERVDLVPLGKTERILSNLSIQGLSDDGKVLLVDMMDGTISIADIHTGKIISSFNRVGRAGNEYIISPYSSPVTVNLYDNQIYVFSIQQKRIQVYDLYGTHLKTIDIQTDNYITAGQVVDGETFVLTHNPIPLKESPYVPNYFVSIVNDKGEVIRTYFPMKFKYAPSFSSYCNRPFQYNGGVLVPGAPMGNDTMYFVTKEEVCPFLITDYGERGEQIKRQFNTKELSFSEQYDPKYFGYYKDLLVGYLLYKEKGYTNIWKKDQLLAFKEGFCTCDLPQGGSVELPVYFIAGNKLIAPVEAFHLVGVIDGVTEDDNPFLVVITLKDNL